MSRPLRIEIANGLYHVMSRGLERRRIARDDGDRERWMELLGLVCARRAWRVYAFALMPNHFHVFLRTPEADLSAGMHDLNSAYVTGFNRRHGRRGPLFQGRYKALLVDDELHYGELVRYIALNPVRARLVDDPADYAWGSHRWLVGARACPAWLGRDEVLREFARAMRSARRAYRDYVLAGIEARPSSPLDGAVAGLLGTRGFVNHMRKRLDKRLPDRDVPEARVLRRTLHVEEVAAATAEVFGVTVDSLRERGRHGNLARKTAIYLTHKKMGLSLREIGAWYGGLGTSAVSNLTRTPPEAPSLQRKLAAIEKKLATT